MKLFRCIIQVVRVYELNVSGRDAEHAMTCLRNMQSADIEECGNLKDCTIESPEILYENQPNT